MYAIAFDLDTNTLQQTYHVARYNNAYYDIRARLANHGFNWQQGSVYYGDDKVNAVTCVLAVMDLTNTYSWFGASVRDIRMLRIEEQNNLRPAIDQALAAQQASSQHAPPPQPPPAP
jgi:virulence-associated protein VapD